MARSSSRRRRGEEKEREEEVEEVEVEEVDVEEVDVEEVEVEKNRRRDSTVKKGAAKRKSSCARLSFKPDASLPRLRTSDRSTENVDRRHQEQRQQMQGRGSARGAK